MSKKYEEWLAELRREINAGESRPAVIDIAVNELLAEGDDRLSKDLLSLLSDKAQHDEGMFSLIHAVESVDDGVYVRSLLSVFPDLMSSSPRWASIVLMRVLNNGSAQLELVRQVRNEPEPIKKVVHDMCKRISGVNPEFLSKTVPVIVAAT